MGFLAQQVVPARGDPLHRQLPGLAPDQLPAQLLQVGRQHRGPVLPTPPSWQERL